MEHWNIIEKAYLATWGHEPASPVSVVYCYNK